MECQHKRPSNTCKCAKGIPAIFYPYSYIIVAFIYLCLVTLFKPEDGGERILSTLFHYKETIDNPKMLCLPEALQKNKVHA